MPSGSLRPTLALFICKQVNLRNTVIDFNRFYRPAQVSTSRFLFLSAFYSHREQLWFLTSAFRQVPDLAFQSGVLPHCPVPTSVLQTPLPPPTQATSTPQETYSASRPGVCHGKKQHLITILKHNLNNLESTIYSIIYPFHYNVITCCHKTFCFPVYDILTHIQSTVWFLGKEK